MKIGLFIQSSNQELFVKNTKILLDYYKRIISKKKYDIQVYSYTSNGMKNNDISIVGNEIFLPCNDGDVAAKTKLLMKVISEKFSDLDVIIKTNNSTVINIEQLYSFILSNEYNEDVVYCCEVVADKTAWRENPNHAYYKSGFYAYPTGNFMLFSKKNFDILYCDYDVSHDYLNGLYTFAKTNLSSGVNDWYGIPEDAIWGYIIHYRNLKYYVFNNTIRISNHVWWKSNVSNIKNPFSYIAVIGKIILDYHSRVIIEPTIIELICKFYEYGVE